jgi:hypothetical protein
LRTEGGFFKETFRDDGAIAGAALPPACASVRTRMPLRPRACRSSLRLLMPLRPSRRRRRGAQFLHRHLLPRADRQHQPPAPHHQR